MTGGSEGRGEIFAAVQANKRGDEAAGRTRGGAARSSGAPRSLRGGTLRLPLHLFFRLEHLLDNGLDGRMLDEAREVERVEEAPEGGLGHGDDGVEALTRLEVGQEGARHLDHREERTATGGVGRQDAVLSAAGTRLPGGRAGVPLGPPARPGPSGAGPYDYPS